MPRVDGKDTRPARRGSCPPEDGIDRREFVTRVSRLAAAAATIELFSLMPLLSGCAEDADGPLSEGARNAVRVCMGVDSEDRVLVLTDDDTTSVAEALLREAAAVNAAHRSVRIEDYGGRPVTQLPAKLADDVRSFAPSVTFFAATARQGEYPLRRGFIDLAVGELRARHAHMPGITPAVVQEGLSVDYEAVGELTLAVHERLRPCKSVHVTSSKGTDLVAGFSDALRWAPCDGSYHEPGEWGNLPEGEVFTCPESVDGVLVADVVGDYFSWEYGILPDPVTIEIADGHAVKITCANKQLEGELSSYLASNENGERVGEFAIGTNIGIKALCGNLLQDEKMPGVHVAFGHPIGDLTGATWSCVTHVDMIPTDCTVYVDGELLMERGRFVGLTP